MRRARERRGGRGLAAPDHVRLNLAWTARFGGALVQVCTCGCGRRALGTADSCREAPLRPGAPAHQSPIHLVARQHLGGGRKTPSFSWRVFGIDGPSRPRRCPRPALWLGTGLDANSRAGWLAFLGLMDDRRVATRPTVAARIRAYRRCPSSRMRLERPSCAQSQDSRDAMRFIRGGFRDAASLRAG